MIHILDESSGEAFWVMGADLYEMPIIRPVIKQKMAAASSTSVPLSINSVGFPNPMRRGYTPFLVASV
jgi:hypothetical protein